MLDRLRDRPVAMALAGALCIAFSAIFYRLAAVSPSTGATLRCVYALPALLALAAWERRRLGSLLSRERFLAITAGAFFAADLVLWHRAIDAVGAGLATVLANVDVVLIGVAAWVLLAERPARSVLASLPVVIVGVICTSGVVGRGGYGRDPLAGAVFGLLTAVAYAGFLLVLRGAGRRGQVAEPLFYATLSTAVIAALAGAVLGDLQLAPPWPAWGWLVLLALQSQVVGWLMISISLPQLPASLTAVLLTVQPVGSLALAALIFAERPSPVQLLGAGAILAGVIVVSSRRRGHASASALAKAPPAA